MRPKCAIEVSQGPPRELKRGDERNAGRGERVSGLSLGEAFCSECVHMARAKIGRKEGGRGGGGGLESASYVA